MDSKRSSEGGAGHGTATAASGMAALRSSARQRVHNWHALFNCVGRQAAGQAPDIRGPVHGFEFFRFAASSSLLPSLSFVCPRDVVQSDCVKVVVQLGGECNMRCGRREATMTSSDWTIHDYSSDIEIRLTADAEQLHFLFPAALFNRRSLGVEPGIVCFGASAGVPRLAGGFLRLVSSEWPCLGAGERTDMIYTAAQLVQLAISERQSTPRMSIQEALRERVKVHIGRNLRDHGLTIDAIADALGCTKRNLHKLFRGDAHTLSAYIWDLRLQRCAADFADPSKRHQTITQVAFSWGFNNAAHFSRLFRERFGMSASLFRERAGIGGALEPVELPAYRRRQGRPGDAARQPAAN